MILQVVFTICKVRTLITFKKFFFLQKEQDEFVVSKFSNLKKVFCKLMETGYEMNLPVCEISPIYFHQLVNFK